jgi:hypothetical protein
MKVGYKGTIKKDPSYSRSGIIGARRVLEERLNIDLLS